MLASQSHTEALPPRRGQFFGSHNKEKTMLTIVAGALTLLITLWTIASPFTSPTSQRRRGPSRASNQRLVATSTPERPPCPVPASGDEATNIKTLAGSGSGRGWRLDKVRGQSLGTSDEEQTWTFRSGNSANDKVYVKTVGGSKLESGGWYFQNSTTILHVGDRQYLFELDRASNNRDRMCLTEMAGGNVVRAEVYEFSSPTGQR